MKRKKRDAAMMREKYVELTRQIGPVNKPVRAARELFPSRPEGYVTATRHIYHYAWNRITELSCDSSTAEIYSSIADRIRDELPQYAKYFVAEFDINAGRALP
jgi:hypothetical protein